MSATGPRVARQSLPADWAQKSDKKFVATPWPMLFKRDVEALEYELMDKAEERLWWYRSLHARLLAALSSARGRLLDAGCGTGGFLKMLGLSRPDLLLTGCDTHRFAASRARFKSRAAITVGSVNALPFATAVFDAVVSADVLCHREVRLGVALLEMRRVLRPGGTLVINMPAFMWLHSAHDRRVQNVLRVTAAELASALRSADLTLVEVRYWNGLLLPFMALRRKLLATHVAATSDVRPLHPLLNAGLSRLMSWERHLLLPAGGSVLAVALRQ